MSDLKVKPDPDAFLKKAKEAVIIEQNNGCRAGYEMETDELYIVWFCKALGNWKALVSTDKFDGIYWEVTHNGAKNETYVDRYTKSNTYAVGDAEIITRYVESLPK